MLIVAVTPIVVSTEDDADDSDVPVGITVVTDVDCGSVVENIIVVDDSWLVSGI